MAEPQRRLAVAMLFAAVLGGSLAAAGVYGVEVTRVLAVTSTVLRLVGVWGAMLCTGASLLAAGVAAGRLDRYQGVLPYPLVAAMFGATGLLFTLTLVPVPRWLLHSGGLVATLVLFGSGSILLEGLV